MIYVNRTEKRNTDRIKTGYYLEHLTSETIKLLRSTQSKVNKIKNGENNPYLKITVVILY